jgi:hypothetical protein
MLDRDVFDIGHMDVVELAAPLRSRNGNRMAPPPITSAKYRMISFRAGWLKFARSSADSNI